MSDQTGVPDLNLEDDQDDFDILLEDQAKAAAAEEDPDKDLPEEYKGLTKAQIIAKEREKAAAAAASAQPSPQDDLKATVDKLAAQVAGASGQTKAEVKKEIEKSLKDDPEFAKRFNEEIFKDNPFGVIYDLIEQVSTKVADRIANQKAQELGSVVGPSLMESTRVALKSDPVDGPIFVKYEKEINKIIQEEVDPKYRGNPQVLTYALNQIKIRKMDEIVQDRVNARMAETATSGKVKEPEHSERASGAAPAKNEGVKREVRLSTSDIERATARGIPIREYARLKSEGKL